MHSRLPQGLVALCHQPASKRVPSDFPVRGKPRAPLVTAAVPEAIQQQLPSLVLSLCLGGSFYGFLFLVYSYCPPLVQASGSLCVIFPLFALTKPKGDKKKMS